MLKVLHVIGPMTTGGAQTQLLGLVKAAHEEHWEATVCATSPGRMTSVFRSTGVPVIELRRWGSPGLLRIRQLRRLIGEGSFDVVHSNLWQSNLHARLAVVGRRSRPKVVISERGLAPDRGRLRRAADQRLRSVTDAWIGNSDAVVDFMASAHGVDRSRVMHIPNAIDKAVFFPSDRSSPSTVLRIGTVGRLTWEKGHEVLIEATRMLVAGGTAVEVHIAGEGPRRVELEALATGLPVHLRGELEPGPEVAAFLRSLDIFVLPSHSEGRPNAVLEAVATGLPTVVCDAPGSVEALDGGGVVVERRSPEALAAAISEVSTSLEAASKRAIVAGDRVLDFEELAVRYRSLFVELTR